MRLDSVRSLKQELCAGCVTAGLGGADILAGQAGIPQGIAVGVVQGGGRADWRLAVRLQRRSQRIEAFAARVASLARGEVDAQFVGPVYGPRPFSCGRPELAARIRPLRPGVSIAHHASTAGTLGAFACDASNRLVILSNTHVLCAPKCSAGDIILQPGPADGGAASAVDVVATLNQWVRLRSDQANYVDAAVATVVSGMSYSCQHGFGGLRGVEFEPASGAAVWKVGRTTGFTRGVIRAVELDGVEVRYGDRTAIFDNQIEIAGTDGAFSDSGDSGSLILDGAGKAVALLFAGTPSTAGKAAATYANPIGAVVQALGIRLAEGN